MKTTKKSCRIWHEFYRSGNIWYKVINDWTIPGKFIDLCEFYYHIHNCKHKKMKRHKKGKAFKESKRMKLRYKLRVREARKKMEACKARKKNEGTYEAKTR